MYNSSDGRNMRGNQQRRGLHPNWEMNAAEELQKNSILCGNLQVGLLCLCVGFIHYNTSYFMSVCF